MSSAHISDGSNACHVQSSPLDLQPSHQGIDDIFSRLPAIANTQHSNRRSRVYRTPYVEKIQNGWFLNNTPEVEQLKPLKNGSWKTFIRLPILVSLTFQGLLTVKLQVNIHRIKDAFFMNRRESANKSYFGSAASASSNLWQFFPPSQKSMMT